MVWLHGTRKRNVQQGFLISAPGGGGSMGAAGGRQRARSVAGGATACPAAAAEAGTAEEKESVARLRPAGAPALPQLMRRSSSPRHIRADRLASRLQRRRTAAWKASEKCPVPARHGESFQAAAGLNTGSGRPPSRPPSFFGLCPPFRRIPDFGLSPAPVCSRLPPARFAPPRLPSRFRHGTARPSCPHQAAACPFPSGTVRMPSLSVCGSRSRPPRFIDGPAATPSFFCSGRREGNISVVPDGGLLYSPLLSID